MRHAFQYHVLVYGFWIGCSFSSQLTPDVDDERSYAADECEADEEPPGGGVAADQVPGPVLHVGVERRLDQQLLVSSLLGLERLGRANKKEGS